MRFNKFLVMLAAALSIVACSNDENLSKATAVAGDYKGYTDADCTFFQNRYTDNECLKITANEDGTLTIVFESLSWGTFNIVSATVAESAGSYLVSGAGSVAMGMGEMINNYDFTMTGTIDAAKENYSIVFNVPAVMGGLTVTFLSGTLPVQ